MWVIYSYYKKQGKEKTKLGYNPGHLIWDKSWKSKAISIWNLKEPAFLFPGVRNTKVWA